MALIPGTRVGPYEIVGHIGTGGMGEVYRARDPKLNRDVALKVLPDSFQQDPDRLARFTREAQVLASLNHPNIAGVYGLEESEGVTAIVMELVEGEDLSKLIADGQPEAESGSPRLRDQRSGGQALGVPASAKATAGPPKLATRAKAGGPQRKERKDGGLPLDEVLAIAKQIADALEAAHEQGIITAT